MQRKLLCGVVAIFAAGAVSTGGASASGPAPPGKHVVEINCEGIGPITVSIPRREKDKGAGQIVGAKGHGIPVVSTFTITDVTTKTVLNSESKTAGGGNAHPNQATTACSTVLSTPASAFFEEGPLPPGVAPTDIIEANIVIDVIVKP
jgi:hypothetical protein